MWKVIQSAPHYEINKDGRIHSLDRLDAYICPRWGKQILRPRKGLLMQYKLIRGYENVTLVHGNGEKRMHQVHRLVMEAFNPVLGMEKLQVNHINGVKNDNRFENLEWCTPLENVRHAYATGLIKPIDKKGSKNLMSKLTEDDVRFIRSCGWDKKALIRHYNVDRKTIENILNRKSWTHV